MSNNINDITDNDLKLSNTLLSSKSTKEPAENQEMAIVDAELGGEPTNKLAAFYHSLDYRQESEIQEENGKRYKIERFYKRNILVKMSCKIMGENDEDSTEECNDHQNENTINPKYTNKKYHSKLLDENFTISVDGTFKFDSGVTYSIEDMHKLSQMRDDQKQEIHLLKQTFGSDTKILNDRATDIVIKDRD